MAAGSIKNYYATKTYVSEFCKLKYKSGDIFLKSLNYNFIDELKTYMLGNPLRPNDPCTNNGCMKHLERVKKIMNWAYEMRFIDRNVFASFKIRKKPSEPIRLTLEQLRKIEQKEFSRSMLNLVKDLFIFCCYTGMAPVDLQYLKPYQIYCESDGTTWLTYTRKKSEMISNVPLLVQALLIVRKYEMKKGDLFRETVFPFVTNKDLNLQLKVISEVCEIGFPLNFYIARHTFASTITLANGVQVTSIKAMMGHSKIESTLQYARVDKSILKKEMMSLQEKMG
ncbi:MAG: site-specific integrase [Chitinophagaceae bacterium]|nr:site-specific integrase [Chitinophagaceae bacterium]